MDFYNYHDNSEKLKGYHEAGEIVPSRVLAQIKAGKKITTKAFATIARNSETAYEYANLTHKPFLQGEDAIAKDSNYAFRYAVNILKKPWPKGEDAIAKNTSYAFYYAFHVLKKPFPKGEDAIAKDAEYACLYACKILGKPFPKGENAIAKEPMYREEYEYVLGVKL